MGDLPSVPSGLASPAEASSCLPAFQEWPGWQAECLVRVWDSQKGTLLDCHLKKQRSQECPPKSLSLPLPVGSCYDFHGCNSAKSRQGKDTRKESHMSQVYRMRRSPTSSMAPSAVLTVRWGQCMRCHPSHCLCMAASVEAEEGGQNPGRFLSSQDSGKMADPRESHEHKRFCTGVQGRSPRTQHCGSHL